LFPDKQFGQPVPSGSTAGVLLSKPFCPAFLSAANAPPTPEWKSYPNLRTVHPANKSAGSWHKQKRRRFSAFHRRTAQKYSCSAAFEYADRRLSVPLALSALVEDGP